MLRIPSFGQEKVIEYIQEELKDGNFYLNSLVFANGIQGINSEVRDIAQYCVSNRIFQFLSDRSKIFLSEVNNIIGMALIQQDLALLKDVLLMYQPFFNQIMAEKYFSQAMGSRE